MSVCIKIHFYCDQLQEEQRLGDLQRLQQQRELERLAKKEEEERRKKEQDAILGRAGNARPKLAFGLKPTGR